MSRTVRRLPVDNRPRANSYVGLYSRNDLSVLKRLPRLMDQNQGFWVYGHWTWIDTNEVQTVQYSRTGSSMGLYRKYIPCAPKKMTKYIGYGGYEYYYYSGPDNYMKGWVWVQNPEFDADAYEEFAEWLRIHRMVYRNGTSYRQRMHGIADMKRRLTRERRNKNRNITRERLNEYWIGDAE